MPVLVLVFRLAPPLDLMVALEMQLVLAEVKAEAQLDLAPQM